jgi:hypothetical protein
VDKKRAIEVRGALLREVEKIVASPIFHTSESLSHLLRYLAQHSIDQPETPPKEYQIATEGHQAPFPIQVSPEGGFLARNQPQCRR